MSVLQIYDTNNWVRKRYEADSSGLALRNLFNLAFHSIEPTIFVFDGKNSKDARRKLYPAYKGHRPPSPDAFNVTLDIFEELVGYTNKMALRMAGYEADDIIATLVRSAPDTDILIHSNDGDFLILCNDLVKMTETSLPKIDLKDIRLYKTLVGDPSDNIKGISGFGDVAWEALGDNRKAMWKGWLDQNPWGKVAAPLPDPADLGVSDKQYLWLKTNLLTIQAYWAIVGFVSVDNDLMMKHLKVGVPNMAIANNLLTEIMQ